MAFPHQPPHAFCAARVTTVHLRARCASCGYLGATQLVEEHIGANGVKRVRLPIPPKRCNGCGLRMPHVVYEPKTPSSL